MKFAYKLCIAVILVVLFFAAKLLKINDMCNFFQHQFIGELIPPTGIY